MKQQSIWVLEASASGPARYRPSPERVSSCRQERPSAKPALNRRCDRPVGAGVIVNGDRREFVLGLLASSLAACGPTRSETERAAAPMPTSDEPATPEPEPELGPDDAIARRVAELEALYGAGERGWVVLAEPPFVVVGDGSLEQVESHARGTVRWAVEKLEAAYFERAPSELITIWLFETTESYERHALELFGERPDTPYGYYSGSDRALVMNIGTGGGTLVHEIVHPYMATNFPACPTWFNEGLASLYEQSAERDGEIIGLTNWRLAGLQAAIRANDLPTFRELCESGEGFYTADRGSNYAQARYLCHWLQEQSLLHRYYREFSTQGHVEDPTGYATLVALVGPDMDDFRARWEAFVIGLRFPADDR